MHGGLTFAEPDIDCGKDGADNAWWLGFDCMHFGDEKDPALMNGDAIAREIAMERAGLGFQRHGVIRTTEYVAGECQRLAQQAADATG